jgi:hypothetical protein
VGGKLQNTNTKLQINHKKQNPNFQIIGLRPCLNSGIWNLFEIWDLLFGCFAQVTLNLET